MNFATASLGRWERWHLWSMLGLLFVFGVLVEIRSAFVDRRMSDLTVFMRAGWAVRAGEDIYQVSDEGNGWYYVYPPLFAILMTPLAESPPGHDRSWMIPYPIAVAIWYVLNLFILAWGVHHLAKAFEETSDDPNVRDQPVGCRRWWALRLIPIYGCLLAIGSSLSHAQTNVIILAMLCATAAAVLRGRSWLAGLWMAGPVCFKVFPAFLVIYPLWRRDWRCAGGFAAGLILGLGLIPSAVFGPTKTVAYYQEFAELVLMPGVGKGKNEARKATLTAITATDTQSFMAMMHNAIHLGSATKPDQPSSEVRLAHWGLSGALALIACLCAGWRKKERPVGEVLFLGMLCMLMMWLSPVCHLSYFSWLLPTIMALMALRWEHHTTLGVGRLWIGLLVLNNLVHVIAHMHDYEIFRTCRQLGLTTYVGLIFFTLAAITLARGSGRRQIEENAASPETRLAA